jgi:hypothetical protein
MLKLFEPKGRHYGKAMALVGVVLTATGVAAHEERSKGPNGGALTHAGAYRVELVTRGTVVDLFLDDANGQPVSAKGLRARGRKAPAGDVVAG